MTDYGTDFSCTDDLETTLVTVSDTDVVIQALYRRYITPRGRLIGDPDYGFEIASYLNSDVSPPDVAWIESQIKHEGEKDERVSIVNPTVTLTAQGLMTVRIDVVLLDNTTFRLVLAVSDVTVSILSVE